MQGKPHNFDVARREACKPWSGSAVFLMYLIYVKMKIETVSEI